MTIRLFLSQNLFEVDTRGGNGDFKKFVRYYDELALAVFFDHFTGDFYAVRFESTDELLKYRLGDTKLSVTPPSESWCVSSGILYRDKIHILPMVNPNRIETIRDLKDAFQRFDQLVDCELNATPQFDFELGQRVIVNTGERDHIGTVTGFMSTTVLIKMESGATSPFKPFNIRKI